MMLNLHTYRQHFAVIRVIEGSVDMDAPASGQDITQPHGEVETNIPNRWQALNVALRVTVRLTNYHILYKCTAIA